MNVIAENHTSEMVTNDEFETKVLASYQRIFSFAMNLTGNRQDAADLTQEAFLHAFRAKDRRWPDRSPEPWLFRITYRCFLDIRRGMKCRPQAVSIDSSIFDTDPFDVPDYSPNPEQIFFQDKLTEPIQIALASLSESQRKLIYLAHFEELSHRELSVIFGCGATTIRTRIHRAHVALRAQLQVKRPRTTKPVSFDQVLAA